MDELALPDSTVLGRDETFVFTSLNFLLIISGDVVGKFLWGRARYLSPVNWVHVFSISQSGTGKKVVVIFQRNYLKKASLNLVLNTMKAIFTPQADNSIKSSIYQSCRKLWCPVAKSGAKITTQTHTHVMWTWGNTSSHTQTHVWKITTHSNTPSHPSCQKRSRGLSVSRLYETWHFLHSLFRRVSFSILGIEVTIYCRYFHVFFLVRGFGSFWTFSKSW